ncbi:hypothetical protein BJ085DRAFT_30246 [Dimargaris cristalligena]|uniref:Uncharacterized protein n=1 Tax=Dimargaris cristalligena TaxID=215637 RepID=A0A4P9ZZT2_9FUNG|nr:hypothetical protein BJ085DRAFT_30246 [Dimargaris cristalligena]|eukprot:RKP38350.1 hypothetical protein BJ085DRAFT_30246 [Dimargaris cristalligena]
MAYSLAGLSLHLFLAGQLYTHSHTPPSTLARLGEAFPSLASPAGVLFRQLLSYPSIRSAVWSFGPHTRISSADIVQLWAYPPVQYSTAPFLHYYGPQPQKTSPFRPRYLYLLLVGADD